MRASDDDREKVAAEQKIHCVEARITLDELDDIVRRCGPNRRTMDHDEPPARSAV
ncbi:MAG: hypothetical protein ACR2JH_11075 [Solirubrobacteraceae bacterium]